jgi:hypothetical protein
MNPSIDPCEDFTSIKVIALGIADSELEGDERSPCLL